MLLCSVARGSLRTLRAFTTSVLAAIDLTQSIVDSTTSSKTSRSPLKENLSQDPETTETWSTTNLTIDDFSPLALNPTHDQEDENNRQKAILISRFYAALKGGDMPDVIVDDLVRMQFQMMLMEMDEPLTELDFSGFSDD